MKKVIIEIMRGAHDAARAGNTRYDVYLPGVPRVGDTVMMGNDGDDQFTVKHVFWDTTNSTAIVRVK